MERTLPPIELEPDVYPGLHGRARLAADAIATVYIAFVAATASFTGIYFIMFPELGALSYDVYERPRGHWSASPIHLATSPVLAAVAGILVTRNLPYGFASVLITVAAALSIITALRSPVAPSISAGLLPLVLGVTSWLYPAGITFGTALLALSSIAWRRYHGVAAAASHASIHDEAEHGQGFRAQLGWLCALLGFVAVAVAVVEVTGMRFVLFPPLVVIGYEMFANETTCPWAATPFRLPMVCLLASAAGWGFWFLFGATPITAACSMIAGIVVLRVSRVHVPPALAVALLPMVMDSPTAMYPVAVGLGTLLLTLWFLGYRRARSWLMAHPVAQLTSQP